MSDTHIVHAFLCAARKAMNDTASGTYSFPAIANKAFLLQNTNEVFMRRPRVQEQGQMMFLR